MIRLLVIQKGSEISSLLRSRSTTGEIFADSVTALKSARLKLAETAYDIVLCDVAMGSAEGRNVVRDLKSLITKAPQTQIILIGNSQDPRLVGIESENLFRAQPSVPSI